MSTLAIVAVAAAVVLLATVWALYRVYMAGTAKGYTWSFGAKWSPPNGSIAIVQTERRLDIPSAGTSYARLLAAFHASGISGRSGGLGREWVSSATGCLTANPS